MEKILILLLLYSKPAAKKIGCSRTNIPWYPWFQDLAYDYFANTSNNFASAILTDNTKISEIDYETYHLVPAGTLLEFAGEMIKRLSPEN